MRVPYDFNVNNEYCLMKSKLVLFILLVTTFSLPAQWQPAGDKIKTRWASRIDVDNVLPEYPRPILERGEWQNLNGLWNYAILPVGKQKPTNYDGQILVPFAVESSLSGVQKRVGSDNELWYQREFTVPSKWKNNKVLLHFGAVDWKTDIWVNGVKVGKHTGGYTPFSFDITPALVNGNNTLVVKVWDSTDQGYQPRGKQVNKPEGIWYTPVTGIWQTVWLEPVPETHIENIRITPDIDKNILAVQAITNVFTSAAKVEVKVKEGSRVVATGQAINNLPVEITMPENVKLWSPDSPHLYDLEITLWDGNKQLDKVASYAAMRKYSMKRDDKGIVRLQLNNKDLFHFGPLDQGWWPDGLYTAPSDEALEYDVVKTKELGFNMIRKHVKVEPARWYTHCDRHGIIVWQDMPNGDRGPEWQMRKYFDGVERVRSAESEANFRKEWKEIMDYLYSYPSIGVWVPFNEAWGQFKTKEIAEWTKQYDPSRLVNPASGGNHYPVGDMLDLHQYPSPQLYLYDGQRATVLGEYGGIGWANKEHLWEPDRNWGYVQFNSAKEVTDEYVKYAEQLKHLIRQGFSAAVYTQTTDVEIEVNGLMTYDRKLVKVEEDRVRKVNQEICNILGK
nr:Glycosyl hydrolase, family 2 [Bacteroidia bacterium]